MSMNVSLDAVDWCATRTHTWHPESDFLVQCCSSFERKMLVISKVHVRSKSFHWTTWVQPSATVGRLSSCALFGFWASLQMSVQFLQKGNARDLHTCRLLEIFDSISCYYYGIFSCTTMPPTVHRAETSLQIRRISHFAVGLQPDDIYHCNYQYCLVSIVSFLSFPVLLCPSAFILKWIHIKDWIKGMAVNAALVREEVVWDEAVSTRGAADGAPTPPACLHVEGKTLVGSIKSPKIFTKFPDIQKSKTKKQQSIRPVTWGKLQSGVQYSFW